MKLFAICVLVLAGLVPAHADTTATTFDFTFTGSGISASGVITANLITAYPTLIPDWEIATLTGTFNGASIVTPVPGFLDFNGGDIGEIIGAFDSLVPNIFFLVNNEITYWQYIPDQSPLTEVEFQDGTIVPVTSVITDPTGPVPTPEPPLFIVTALLLLGLMLWARRSLARHYSA